MLTYVKLVLTAMFWGGTFIAGRLLAGVGVATASFLRFVVACLFLLMAVQRMEGRLPAIPRGRFWQVLGLGLTGVFLYNVFFLWGMKTVPAGRASLIIAAAPALIAVLSAWLFQEPFHRGRVLGVIFSVSGAMIVLSRGNPLLILSEVGMGDLAIVACVASWVIYSLLGKQVMGKMTPLDSVLWSCILGCALIFPFALSGGLVADLGRMEVREWLCVVFLGVFGTGLGFLWYFNGIKKLGAFRAGVFLNLEPVCAVLMGWSILGEPLGWSLAAGAACIFLGVWLVNRP